MSADRETIFRNFKSVKGVQIFLIGIVLAIVGALYVSHYVGDVWQKRAEHLWEEISGGATVPGACLVLGVIDQTRPYIQCQISSELTDR